MTQPTRFRMTADLPVDSTPSEIPELEHPLTADVPDLAVLMLAAYRGTPDEADAGQSIASATEEIRRVFDGEYGGLISEASFLTREEGEPVAVTLVTAWQGEPLLAYVFTAPSHTGLGLARNLVKASMAALTAQGHRRVNLAVTENNPRAWKLYESIGFRRFDSA